MAWVLIESYYVRYNTLENQAVIGIYYREGGNAERQLLVKHLPVPTTDAFFLADLLRNEGPVFYDPENGAIASGKEVVGEGEPSGGGGLRPISA